MRYVMLGCLLAAAFPACAYNETVSAISYNPSRVGAYTKLKIAQEATLKGGLEVVEGTDLNFQSKNGITLTDHNNRCTGGTCTSTSINTITNVKPHGYSTDNKCDAGFSCGTGLYALNVMIQGENTTPVDVFSYGSTAPSSGLLPALEVYGGTMEFNSSGGQDSYIASIPNNGGTNGTVARLTMTANEVYISKKLYVKETLKLGNITIIPKTGSQSEYAFVGRKAKDSKTYYVLAVK